MGNRTGRQVAPLAAALLVTLAACAAPPAGPQTGASTGAPSSGASSSTSAAGVSPATVTAPAPATAAQPASTGQPPTSSGVTAAASAASSAATSPAASPATSAASSPTASAAPVTSGAGEAVSPLPSCSAATLPTSERGSLTFAVSSAAGVPWIVGDPAQGQGFEAAVGAAVAQRLGYAADRVHWKPAAAATVQAAKVPGADVGLGEFRTPDQAGGPVDYTTGYFSVSDSVVARVGTPAARLTGVPALGKLRVASLTEAGSGAARLPSRSGTAYASAAAALAALRRGAVDVAVVSTPVAVTAGADIAVLGQLTRPTEQPPQFGMVLPKHSPLTACVSAAIDQLRVTGALAALVQRWVPAANKPLQ